MAKNWQIQKSVIILLQLGEEMKSKRYGYCLYQNITMFGRACQAWPRNIEGAGVRKEPQKSSIYAPAYLQDIFVVL